MAVPVDGPPARDSDILCMICRYLGLSPDAANPFEVSDHKRIIFPVLSKDNDRIILQMQFHP